MKLWLIGVTTEGHLEDLKELIEPIKEYFDGLVWTFHYPKDEGAEYLESAKGEGEIIYTKWCDRLDFSRNHSLFQGPMKMGDWFVTIDTLERLNLDFVKNLRKYIHQLEPQGIDGSQLFGKRFMFKLKEETAFVHNPHEGLLGANQVVELTNTRYWKEGTEKEVKKAFVTNVRAKKRKDPFYFVKHNFKYYFFPKSNHLILGFENDKKLIEKRYKIREELFNEINRLGFYPYDQQSVRECFGGNLTTTLKKCINFDKFLNDWYRYEILGEREGIIDKHDFSVFKPINFQA